MRILRVSVTERIYALLTMISLIFNFNLYIRLEPVNVNIGIYSPAWIEARRTKFTGSVKRTILAW